MHRLARAVGCPRRLDEHAGLVRHAEGARPRFRSPARADPRDRRAARWRIRRQVRPRRAARRGRHARAAPPGPTHADALRGLPGDESSVRPGHAPEDRGAQGRDVHRYRGAHDRRPRIQRRLGCRGNHVAPRRRPVPLAGTRNPRLRRADEPLHLRRVPCARRADGRLRARVAPRRARADRGRLELDPIEMRLRNAVVEGDIGISGSPYPDDRRGGGPRAAPRAPLVGRAPLASGGRGNRHGCRALARWKRAGRGRLPGRQPTGR